MKEGYIYPKCERPIRDLLRRRMPFVHHRTSIMLSLEALLGRETSHQLGWGEVCRLGDDDWQGLLHNDDLLVFTARHEMGLTRYLSEKIRLFEDQVEGRIHLRPEYKLLLTMPGIGKIPGRTIMLETGDIDRFRKVGNFTSYCRCARAKL